MFFSFFIFPRNVISFIITTSSKKIYPFQNFPDLGEIWDIPLPQLLDLGEIWNNHAKTL